MVGATIATIIAYLILYISKTFYHQFIVTLPTTYNLLLYIIRW